MPIFDCDPKTRRFSDHTEFIVRCDACPDNMNVAQLNFSFFHPNDEDEYDGYDLYIQLTPDRWPLRLRDRIRMVWQILTKGRVTLWDEICLEKRSVEAFSQRLADLAGMMKSRSPEDQDA